MLLIAYMCPSSLEIDISSSFFLHFWQGDNRNFMFSRGQLAPCQENRIKRQQTVSSAGCKVLAPNAGFLLASMSSYCRFRPIECCYSQSVSVSVPQDKVRGSAIDLSLSDWNPALGCGDWLIRGVMIRFCTFAGPRIAGIGYSLKI